MTPSLMALGDQWLTNVISYVIANSPISCYVGGYFTGAYLDKILSFWYFDSHFWVTCTLCCCQCKWSNDTKRNWHNGAFMVVALKLFVGPKWKWEVPTATSMLRWALIIIKYGSQSLNVQENNGVQHLKEMSTKHRVVSPMRILLICKKCGPSVSSTPPLWMKQKARSNAKSVGVKQNAW